MTSTLTTVTTTGVTVTSTTTSFTPMGSPSAAPTAAAYVKEYSTKTTVVCTKTSVASGGQIQAPCGQLPPSATTSLNHGIPKTETKTVRTPSSNVTVMTTRDPCSETKTVRTPSSNVTVTTTRDPCSETKTSTTSACVGSCPAMTTTVSVTPTNKWVGPINKDDTQVFGMTKQQCICKMALKFSGANSAYACDPYAPNRFLVCQRDGVVQSEPCAAGTSWNYVLDRCCVERKCRPIPAVCAGL